MSSTVILVASACSFVVSKAFLAPLIYVLLFLSSSREILIFVNEEVFIVKYDR
jgi:hypothetical protein